MKSVGDHLWPSVQPEINYSAQKEVFAFCFSHLKIHCAQLVYVILKVISIPAVNLDCAIFL